MVWVALQLFVGQHTWFVTGITTRLLAGSRPGVCWQGGGMALAGVDVVEVPLMMDNDGRLCPNARGIVLRDLVRRDVSKLIQGLSTIDIRWKKIGDRMAKELADLLRKCPKVRSLDVQDNFIGCIGYTILEGRFIFA